MIDRQLSRSRLQFGYSAHRSWFGRSCVHGTAVSGEWIFGLFSDTRVVHIIS